MRWDLNPPRDESMSPGQSIELKLNILYRWKIMKEHKRFHYKWPSFIKRLRQKYSNKINSSGLNYLSIFGMAALIINRLDETLAIRRPWLSVAQLVEWHRRSAVRISPSQLLIASKCVYLTIEWKKTKINYKEARCGPIKKVPLKAPYQVMILRAKFAKRNLVLRSKKRAWLYIYRFIVCLFTTFCVFFTFPLQI